MRPQGVYSRIRFQLLILPACALLAHAAGRPGQTPPPVLDGTAKLAGAPDPAQNLRLVFGLQPPHWDEEQQFLRDLHTKDSPQFHHFLTADEWNARFAPSAADEQAVVDWAQAQGLTVTKRYSNRLLVDVQAPVAAIERALQVRINHYQLGAIRFFSNDREPAIPAHLAGVIHSVQGLNSLQRLQPRHRGAHFDPGQAFVSGPVSAFAGNTHANGDLSKRPANGQKSANNGPQLSHGFYDPADIFGSNAYDYYALYALGHCCNPLNNGTGSPVDTSIAIATSGDVSFTDTQAFINYYGLADNISKVFVDGTPACCSTETTLDVEWATATANSYGSYLDTAQVWAYEGANALVSTFTDIYNQILTDGHARIFSSSWGCAENVCYNGPTMDTDDAIFSSMVGQGWTLVVAADDNGATAIDSTGHCVTTGDTVDYPASDPNVVAAGGTSLLLSSNSSFNSEIAWIGDTAPGSCDNNNGGGGGGISAYYDTPAYQTEVPGNTGKRTVPDISLNAYYGQNYYYQGSWVPGAGTSIVAPEMAGFFAQENAYLLYLGTIVGNTCGATGTACAPLGNANYYFYFEALHAPFASHYPFYDITYGCNSNDVTATYHLPYFCAATGYDMATGWGSANMLQLAWAINMYLAGDFGGPVITFSGPATGRYYNTDQTVKWTISDTTLSAHPATGVAGYTEDWDAPTGDVYSEPTPGSGGPFYVGPEFPNATAGTINLSSAGTQGCHTLHVAAWDNTGYPSAEQLFGPICYDTISPSTSASLIPAPNGAGWNNTTVQVKLTAVDPGAPATGSGVAETWYSINHATGPFAPYGAPVSFASQGQSTVYYYSQDIAGNVETTQQVNVWVDETPPHTTATVTGTSSATVTLTATDNLSGVASTVYQLDSGSWQTYTKPFVVATAGSHTVLFYSTDVAGNVETTESTTFTVYASSFTISGQISLSGAGALAGATVTLSGSQSATTVTNSAGTYSFTAVAGGTFTVTPTLAGYSFIPPSLSIPNLTANDTSANFVANAITAGLRFVPMAPCRVVDTRDATKPIGFGPPAIGGGTFISYAIPNGPCSGIPSTAQAYSLNVTVVPRGTLGYLTVWPTGQTQPLVSTLNSIDGEVKANAAIVSAGTGGAISAFATNTTDLVLDINGYFISAAEPAGLEFYPVTPCRLVDTRAGAPSSLITGRLAANSKTTLPILSSPCGIPATAQAYSLNFTLVPPAPVGYLTVYPTGEAQPIVSTLNDPTGTVEANAAITPAGTGGSIDVFVTSATDLLVDVNGYFAPPATGGLSLYNVTPCRVLDSRNPSGSPPFSGVLNVNVTGSGCVSTSAAQAYVFNATVVPQGFLGYLTLWAQGNPQPTVSTLNAYNGLTTSNMAIVPTTTTEVSAYASSNTYLVLDLYGYFAP